MKLPFRKTKSKIGAANYIFRPGSESSVNPDTGSEKTIIELYDGVDSTSEKQTTAESNSSNVLLLGAVVIGLYLILK